MDETNESSGAVGRGRVFHVASHLNSGRSLVLVKCTDTHT